MAVNNPINLGGASGDIFAEYKFEGSFYETQTPREYAQKNINKYNSSTERVLSFNDIYTIPLSSVKGQVNVAEKIIIDTQKGIENFFLRKLFINPYIDPDLNEAHLRVWKEASIYMDIPATRSDVVRTPESTTVVITMQDTPSYICFDEYAFAERFATTACRRLVSEFDEAISQSTFSYFFQLRKLLSYLANEIKYIKSSLLFDFGADYESESQQKIALRFDTWAKMALHYTRRIANTILSKPGEIPYAEVDQITKKQAAKFQAFFAIRLNAVDEEINDILSSLKRDLVDESEIFYSRYIRPSIKLTKDIVEPLDLEFKTTNFQSKYPSLVEELLAARTVFQGNFASIHADAVERFEMMISKIDAVMMLIHEKRKYANYLAQLSEKAVSKKKILDTVLDDNYSSLFRSAIFNPNRNNTYVSSHANLDDLDQDSHPQYLLKSGGTITGDINVDPGVKIGGVSISDHTHSGDDGSNKISSLSIDFDKARRENSSTGLYALTPVNISIDGFISDIIDGGIPVFDAIISIETDDSIIDSYEYEIIYTEIET